MDVLYQYFLLPIMRNGWFNPVNSLVYGLFLVAGSWLVFKLLRRLKIPIDGRLYLSLLPFIAFAGVTRTLRDYIYFSVAGAGEAGFYQSFLGHMQIIQEKAYDYTFGATGNSVLASINSHVIAWFPTPGSYLITFLLALSSLFVSLIIEKYGKIPYWKTLFAFGFALLLLNGALLPVNSYTPLLYIGIVSIGWTVLFFSIQPIASINRIKKMSKRCAKILQDIFTKINSAILSAHFFDATATFFAIAVFSTMAGQGYAEQHFLSRALIPFLGPQVMFLLKFAVVIPVLYFTNKYVEEKEFRNFLLLVILILGLAPATRNLARLLVGV